MFKATKDALRGEGPLAFESAFDTAESLRRLQAALSKSAMESVEGKTLDGTVTRDYVQLYLLRPM